MTHSGKGSRKASERYTQELEEATADGSYFSFKSNKRGKDTIDNQPAVPPSSFTSISSTNNEYINPNEIGSSSTAQQHPAGQVDLSKQKKKTKSAKKAIALKRPGSDSSSRFKKNSSSLSNNFSGRNSGGGFLANKPQPEKKKEENIDSVDFWIDPIFNKLEVAAVMKLVDSYQVRKVSTGVFYSLVDDMNHDERVEVREFGVYALSSTPSAKSFSLLAWVKQNDTAADIRTSAFNQVASYSDASRLSHIVSALRSSSSTADTNNVNTSLEAMKVVQTATEKYASLVQQGNPKAPPKNALQAISRITQAADVINSSQLKSNNATVKAEARKTIDTVQRYISL